MFEATGRCIQSHLHVTSSPESEAAARSILRSQLYDCFEKYGGSEEVTRG